MQFKNRLEAAKKLAQALLKYKNQDVVLYSLPRGGIVLGVEIARQLKAPLDLIIPRKIGHPSSAEYAICALAEGGSLVCNEAERKIINQDWLKKEVKKEQQEAIRRSKVYLAEKKRLSATNKVAIIVDDGIATGLTIKAAILDIKKQKPKKIVIAVPVLPKDTAADLRKNVDELISLEEPWFFKGAIGSYYQEFGQVSDEEVIALLNDFKS
ncbi:MAG: phosphoribosyltransferase family protein [Candidatus Woesebacteria bacterium]|jgi:predicted phosphoribosyltransferase